MDERRAVWGLGGEIRPRIHIHTHNTTHSHIHTHVVVVVHFWVSFGVGQRAAVAAARKEQREQIRKQKNQKETDEFSGVRGARENAVRSTRRTRRLKIEAQRRLGLKIAGDALRTHETRTHGQKPSQMGRKEGRRRRREV